MKEEIRPDKVLGQIMLDNFEEYFKFGICYLLLNLHIYKKLSYKERKYIESLLPGERVGSAYCWPVSERPPRLKWIQETFMQGKKNHQ